MRVPITPRKRFEILRRDGFRCRLCGRSADAQELHVDHRIPVALGGASDHGNLWTLCRDCNLGKGKMLIERMTVTPREVGHWAYRFDWNPRIKDILRGVADDSIEIGPLETAFDRYIATVVRAYLDLESDPYDDAALGGRLFQMLSSAGWFVYPIAMQRGRPVAEPHLRALWLGVWERLTEADRRALVESCEADIVDADSGAA